jgi:hypothetical protein
LKRAWRAQGKIGEKAWEKRRRGVKEEEGYCYLTWAY